VPLRLAALLLLAALACGCGAAPGPGSEEVSDPAAFEDFPLYDIGDAFEDTPLESVSRRPGYVEFRYGSDSRLLLQIWPGCVRNPMLREGVLLEGARIEQELRLRGATVYVFEGGGRVEIPTRGATIVVRTHGLREAKLAVQALEGVNNPLERNDPLPAAKPTQVSTPCSANDPEASEIAGALEAALAEGAQSPPTIIGCSRSLAVSRTGEFEDAHDCAGFFDPDEALQWCALSRADDPLAATVAGSCETAVSSGASSQPFSEEATLRWGVRARAVCEPHLALVAEAIAAMDQERVATDLSYVWEVMGGWEADVVADLRTVPAPSAEAEELLALYEERIQAIDAAVAEYHAGGQDDALATLRRIEDATPELVRRFEAVGAPACAPPW
jgi:hypothetical protein